VTRDSKSKIALHVEEVEARQLPSGVTPVLTTHTLAAVVAGVERVATNLARTDNVAQAAASLERLSSKLPFGLRQLDPAWTLALAGFNAQVPGSAVAIEHQLLTDLKRDLATGIATGEFRLTGPGAATISRSLGAPLASLDSVTIANKAGLNITVTAALKTTARTLTRTIASGSSLLIDFTTSTGNFISINVARADGRTPPPPLSNLVLNRPISGYNGKSFTVSVFAGFFSVTV
jgi:hypothetical protein